MRNIRAFSLLAACALAVGCSCSESGTTTASLSPATGITALSGRPGGPTVGRGGSTIVGASAGGVAPRGATPGRCPFYDETCQMCVGESCLKEAHACTGSAACAPARATASACLCGAQNAGGGTSACLSSLAQADATSAAFVTCLNAHCAAACAFR